MARARPASSRQKRKESQGQAARDLRRERDERIKAEGLSHWFSVSARRVSGAVGTPWGFIAATTVVVVWLASGPVFGFSDTWQLVINTGTTIVTFLMVFLIQNTQNRDAAAIHLKLDELIRAVPQARNEYMESEEEDMEEILREKAEVDEADPRPPSHKAGP